MARTLETTWDIRTYDVWGNATEGYEVNDTYSHGEITLSIPIDVNNEGTTNEFDSATPTDRQIREAFDLHGKFETDGDDVTIYVSRAKDEYPIGEMHCTSHASLSPIREV